MFVIMNLDKWNSLPPDIQKIFDDIGGATAAELSDKVRWKIELAELPKAPEAFGLEIIEYTPEELARWVEADKAAQDKYVAQLEAKGIPGREFFDEYMMLEKKYSAAEYAPK